MIVVDGIELHRTEYAEYYVSKCGQVYSFKSRTFLKFRTKNNGYLQVALYTPGISKRGKYTHVSVHRLVMQTFFPAGRNEHINHRNGNKTDNRIENLEWCTVSHNLIHSWASGHRKAPARATYLNQRTGVYYEGLREAAQSVGLTVGALSQKLSGRVKNYTGIIHA